MWFLNHQSVTCGWEIRFCSYFVNSNSRREDLQSFYLHHKRCARIKFSSLGHCWIWMWSSEQIWSYRPPRLQWHSCYSDIPATVTAFWSINPGSPSTENPGYTVTFRLQCNITRAERGSKDFYPRVWRENPKGAQPPRGVFPTHEGVKSLLQSWRGVMSLLI